MTMHGVILGTAAYMAPEQAKGRSVDRRADIWSFGCVLYEMLTASRAFDGEDTPEILGAIVKTEPDWSRLPPRHLRTSSRCGAAVWRRICASACPISASLARTWRRRLP